jgi:hypothetical protein
MKIIQVVVIDDQILIVYYTSAKCYQFFIIEKQGKIQKFDSIFYTAEGAKREGRLTIKAVS